MAVYETICHFYSCFDVYVSHCFIFFLQLLVLLGIVVSEDGIFLYSTVQIPLHTDKSDGDRYQGHLHCVKDVILPACVGTLLCTFLATVLLLFLWFLCFFFFYSVNQGLKNEKELEKETKRKNKLKEYLFISCSL